MHGESRPSCHATGVAGATNGAPPAVPTTTRHVGFPGEDAKLRFDLNHGLKAHFGPACAFEQLCQALHNGSYAKSIGMQSSAVGSIHNRRRICALRASLTSWTFQNNVILREPSQREMRQFTTRDRGQEATEEIFDRPQDMAHLCTWLMMAEDYG
jgi:hypothetical protein